jgi:hypothetical protein
MEKNKLIKKPRRRANSSYIFQKKLPKIKKSSQFIDNFLKDPQDNVFLKKKICKEKLLYKIDKSTKKPKLNAKSSSITKANVEKILNELKKFYPTTEKQIHLKNSKSISKNNMNKKTRVEDEEEEEEEGLLNPKFKSKSIFKKKDECDHKLKSKKSKFKKSSRNSKVKTAKLEQLKPLNLNQEKKKFFELKGKYNPQFIYSFEKLSFPVTLINVLITSIAKPTHLY